MSADGINVAAKLYGPVITCTDDHRYFVNGARVLGVSEVLRAVGIINADHYTDEARDRGTAVHALAKYLADGVDDIDEESIDPIVRPYWLALQELWRVEKPVVTSSEKAVWHPVRRYAGTLDATVMSPHLLAADADSLDLWDYKTGDVLPWHWLQLSAYQEAHNAGVLSTGLRIKNRHVVQLLATGKYIIHAPRTTHAEDLGQFYAALQTAQWMRKNRIIT